MFLKDKYHDYSKGSFTNEEESLHAKLIMDMIKHIDEGYMDIRVAIDVSILM